jgi:hypothetical protein
MTVVRYEYRYKRPPLRKPEAAAIEIPAVPDPKLVKTQPQERAEEDSTAPERTAGFPAWLKKAMRRRGPSGT